MYKRGTIVLVPFPFTDLSGGKVRPALIISKEKSSDVIVVFITSKIKTAGVKSLVVLHPNEENGIKVKSGIICDKIATLDKKVILGELGYISEFDQANVDKMLKKVLGL
ncbi:MAG: type II toxin-antitoxin system PemK/MazF family toxin [Candidatus Nomurabacteria bacterium]|nr:type II toxin-antitoxin system PemK/MazF family toxin [Candidatus Nomurabacteria bacterium]USN87356.1 MAG: type II toxin-antitoxin system PemK/MazF family toxin [Candidatus Nomurabacteria bacterium]